jgi:hypothetical protein
MAPKSMPNISASILLIVCIERAHFVERTGRPRRVRTGYSKKCSDSFVGSSRVFSRVLFLSLESVSLSLELAFAA